jgi:hypothetical protein
MPMPKHMPKPKPMPMPIIKKPAFPRPLWGGAP